jgi:hypothetical protein
MIGRSCGTSVPRVDGQREKWSPGVEFSKKGRYGITKL